MRSVQTERARVARRRFVTDGTFLDRIEDRLEEAGSSSPIPRVVIANPGADGEDAERDARLLNAATAAVERSRQRSLRKHVQVAVTEVMALLDSVGSDELVALDAKFVDIARALVNEVLDDVEKDLRNRLRLTAAVHPATHSHNPKENP